MLKSSRMNILFVGAMLFVGLFFISHIPYYSDPLKGEEGMWADILLNHPAGPKYLLGGRIDGVKIYGEPLHPAPIYVIQSVAGRLIQKVIQFDHPASQKVAKLRLSYSLFSFIVLLGLAVYVLNSTGEQLMLFLAILYVTTSPMAIVTGNMQQVDGSVGVLLYGILGFGLLFAFTINNKWINLCILLLCGTLFSLGKNEWTFLMVITVLATFLYLLAAMLFGKKNRWMDVAAIAVLATGCLIGNIICYIVDPFNYVQGWKLMMRLSNDQSILNSSRLGTLIMNWQTLIPAISVSVVLWVGTTILLWKDYKKDLSGVPFRSLFSYVLASASTFSFLMSTWPHADDVRYFAPGMIMALFSYVILSERNWKSLEKFIITAILTVLILNNAWQIHRHRRWMPMGERKEATKVVECVNFVSTADAWDRDNMDFWGNSYSRDEAEGIVLGYGKKLCK